MDGRFGYLSAVQKQYSGIEERANIKINFNSAADCTSQIKRTVCDEHCYVNIRDFTEEAFLSKNDFLAAQMEFMW